MKPSVSAKKEYLVLQENAFDTEIDEDPLSGAANLLDVGLVFIVSLILSLFHASHLSDLFSENSNYMIMKQNSEGSVELIRKEGKKIEAVKITKSEAEGRGVRLGTAYQLEDGSMVYLPD